MVKASKPETWKYYGALAIIVLISFIAYLPVLNNGFVLWDDDIYIQNNPLIYSINLKEIFSKYVLGNYHPLTILILAIEYHFFGLNETGYHAVNLFLHLINVILVCYAVFILSEKAGVALVASLLFGIHPMHVESVAWAAELKDLLYTFFFLASYIFYLKYLKERRKNFYVFALFLFLASLLSKAMAASLPLVLILTDYFKERKITITTLRDKIPFFILAIAFGIVAVLAQKTFGATDVVNFTFPQRVLFACFGFISYLFKLLLPLNLSAYYPYPINSGENIPIQYYAYLLLFAGLVIAVIYSIRVTKKIFFGIGFFAITIFLVLQLLPVGGAIMADRYSYIPSIGIFYLAGEGFILLWNKKLKFINVSLLVAFTVFFSVKTYARCGIWKNTMTLWNDVISQYQTIAFVYNNRGNAFVAEKQYDKAFDDFNKAIELDPKYYLAYYNRGNFFMGEKQYDRAYDEYSKVIELNPKYIEAYINRGIVLRNINRYDEALNDYNKAIELDPQEPETWNLRGVVKFNLDDHDGAIRDYTKAIELDPINPMYYDNRALSRFEKEDYQGAIEDYTSSIELFPTDPETFYQRALVKLQVGNKYDACLDFKTADELGSKEARSAMRKHCK